MSRRTSHHCVFLMIFMLAISCLCIAEGPASLKSELNKPDEIWVGQRLELSVTLYTTISFRGVPRFSLPRDSGMVIIVSDDRPLLGSETIDGTSYMSKQYSISIFPLRAGTLTLPSFQVEFAYQGDDGQRAEISLPTTAQQFTVMDVPGSDPELPMITGEDVKVDDQWEPKPGKATVGDAFLRTVTMTATGLPGMAFPPLKVDNVEGLAIYPRQPQVSTDTERGAFIGKRVENYSYVCQKAGTYTLPEMKVQWWNPTDKTLQVVKLNPVTLKVAPNPLLETQEAAAAAASLNESSPWWRWPSAVVLIAVAAFLLILLLRKKVSRSAPSRKKIEKEAFKQFKLAAKSNGAAETMQTLLRWLDVSGHAGSVSEFIRLVGDPKLKQQLDALEASLYSKQKMSWSGKALYRKVAHARKLLRHQHIHPGRRFTLGPLNP
jgi:hypothetical protein